MGGHGKIEEADPNHELMFFDSGMTGFFVGIQKKLKQEGITEDAVKNMFSGIKGIVLLDTIGNADKCIGEIEKLNTGLSVLEIKEVGLNNLKRVISEAVEVTIRKQ